MIKIFEIDCVGVLRCRRHHSVKLSVSSVFTSSEECGVYYFLGLCHQDILDGSERSRCS